jgi:hypothetical protein
VIAQSPKKLNVLTLAIVFTPNMQVMNNQTTDARTRTALGSLESEIKKKMESFKVKGVAYQEFQTEDPGSKGRMLPRVGNEIPSQPAYTSWSGLLRCPPNSPYAARLMEKCGGVAIGENDAEFTEADAKKKAEATAKEKPAEEKPAEKKKMKSEAEKAAEKKKQEFALWLKSINPEADKKKAAEAKKEETRWWRSATAVIGYWTAPEDWREMLDGNEAPTPCSTEDYPKQSFQPSWA